MLYGPFSWSNAGTPLPGYFCITDPATFAANSALLTPYYDTSDPLGTVLAGDTQGLVTIGLHFADLPTAQTVMAEVNGPPPVNPPDLPDEIAMLRVKIVMAETPSSHGGMLVDRVPVFIATLPTAQQLVANYEWGVPPPGAPNLVTSSAFAQGFKAWEGISDSAWAELLAQAVNLAL